MLYVNVTAPSAPVAVFVTSNVTGAIVVQWESPKLVIHRVDRYYIHYQAVNEPDSREVVIDEVHNSYDVYQVNTLTVSMKM